MSGEFGTLYGVGIGPGDPELVTVKAARIIGEVDVIAYHSARHGHSIARHTAQCYFRSGQVEELLIYPITADDASPEEYSRLIEQFYVESAERLAKHLRAGRSIALLAAGDPLFYSSFMYMFARLRGDFATEVIPGVTAVSAVSCAVAEPLVEHDEVLTVLPGTLDRSELARRLSDTDAAVIMKLGRTFGSVKAALADSGRLDEAMYVERATTDREKVCRLVDADENSIPYFSAAVIPSPESARVSVLSHSTADSSSDPGDISEPNNGGYVVVVGLGPGTPAWTTPETSAALRSATDIVGYSTYVQRYRPQPGQAVHASDNRVEVERAAFALELARRGHRVAVISGGDPGVFAMAAAVCEAVETHGYHDVSVTVLPGVTAASAVAARVGAPLGHDFALISLSDRLKPWSVVETRVRALISADMAFAVYNPASRSRREQVAAFRELIVDSAGKDRVVIVGRDVGGPTESVVVTSAENLDIDSIDMRTLLIVGSSTTRVVWSPPTSDKAPASGGKGFPGRRPAMVYTPRSV